jgi:hypothetical protein
VLDESILVVFYKILFAFRIDLMNLSFKRNPLEGLRQRCTQQFRSHHILATSLGILMAAKIKKIGRPFVFKGLIIGTSPYFGADSATKKYCPASPQLVFERSLATFPVTSELWLQYTRYLEAHLKVGLFLLGWNYSGFPKDLLSQVSGLG